MKRFRNATIASFALWLLSLATLIYVHSTYPILKENSSKYTKYRSSKESRIPEAIFQYRTQVSKDLWIASNKERTYCHLESPSSTLAFITNNNLIESLEQLKFWIHEHKQVRYLHADHGVLNYSKHILTSKEALLSTYHGGDSLLTCLAKDLTLSFDTIPPSFNASQFSAHLKGSL